VSGNVSVGYQNANSDTQIVTNSNAQLSAGGAVTLKSGKDTTVAGARVEGAQVTADVGGDLKVESRQDTLRMESSKVGFSLSVGTGLGGSAGASGVGDAVAGVPAAIASGGEGKQKTGTLGLSYGEGERGTGLRSGDLHVLLRARLSGRVMGSSRLRRFGLATLW